jgi:hypothetical protein
LEKLEFRKYDPRVNRHVLFTEAKMKWEGKAMQEVYLFLSTFLDEYLVTITMDNFIV